MAALATLLIAYVAWVVTALSPVIGIAHYAMDNDLTLKDAALKLGFVREELFDRVARSGENGKAVRSRKIIRPKLG
jgi:fumarate hydratase class II